MYIVSRKSKAAMNQMRILICRTDRIGDVVLSTHLPEEIKNNDNSIFIAVLVREYTKDIYLNNPFIDELILLPEGKISFTEKIKFIHRIRKYNFTHSFMLIPTSFINWSLFFAGIKYRIGSGNRFYQFLTNTKNAYRRKHIQERHEADYCSDQFRKFGFEVDNVSPKIYLSEDEKKLVEKKKQDLCPDRKKLIGIHFSSGKSAPNMPLAEYIKLIELLKNNKLGKIVITDNIIPEEIKKIDGISFVNENSSLRETILNLACLDILISASTGPMHIAAALKIKTLSLFCPLPACSPNLWRPLGNESQIILPEQYYCQEVCPGDPHICQFSGEGGIDANKVLEHILMK